MQRRIGLSLVISLLLSLILNMQSRILHPTLSNFSKLGTLYSKQINRSNLLSGKHFDSQRINIIVLLVVVAANIIFLSSSNLSQYASALSPVAQITSAKSDGSIIPDEGITTTHYGQTPAKVTFTFRGFDDNHIRELRCSFDGVSYLKGNCSSESIESRSIFAGPDGVSRTYYLKTGTASRELPPRTIPYTFGVMVITDKQETSIATWKFKILQGVMPEIGVITAARIPITYNFAEESDPWIKNGGVIKTVAGQASAEVMFEYRGFADDHIATFLCSFDAVNYDKNNCSTHSAESQTSFVGPDGVSRNRYTVVGKATHVFASGYTIHTFGAKVVTEKNVTSAPEIFTFKVEHVPALPPPREPTSMNKHVIKLYDIQIHNTHEGALSGDGEYDLNLYAHGKLFSLTDYSRRAGGAGLWDVSKDETVKFPQGSEIVVDVPENIRFSIFTVGSEDDGCGRTAYPPNVQDKILSVFKPIAKYNDMQGAFDDAVALGKIQDELDKTRNCTLNSNDDLEDIVKVFNPNDPGGLHGFFALRNTDFMLRFYYGWSPIYK